MKQTIELAHLVGDIVFHINSSRKAYANKIKAIRISDKEIRYIGDRYDFCEAETVYETLNEATIEIIKQVSEDLT